MVSSIALWAQLTLLTIGGFQFLENECLMPYQAAQGVQDMCIGPADRTQNLCEINALLEWQLEVRREAPK